MKTWSAYLDKVEGNKPFTWGWKTLEDIMSEVNSLRCYDIDPEDVIHYRQDNYKEV